ncbi:hypothetical protein QEN19_004230 [Hanseniaspora menglaensis]
MLEMATKETSKELFSEPTKHINDDSSNNNNKIKFFQMTKGYKRLIKYSTRYNKLSMQNEMIVYNDDKVLVEIFTNFFFNKILKVVEKYPALAKEEFDQRFGNIAIRSIHDELAECSSDILNELFSKLYQFRVSKENQQLYKHDEVFLKSSIIEVSHYFLNSFGNRDRMDFGTGHELSFLAFLASFEILGIIDFSAYTIKILFSDYYKLVKKLIIEYNLEPAGSHGVWGLDDNFHFSYVLGTAQLIDKPLCKPSDSIKYAKDITDSYEPNTNFLIWNLQLIGEVKKYKNFKEHSPMLNDILNSVNDWSKINKGLYKMWIDEVLLKFPVIQHFKFGTYLFPWKITKKKKQEIKELRKTSTTTEQEKSDLLKYRMNKVTVEGMINKSDSVRQEKSSTSKNSRLFPMNPPKRKFKTEK